MAAVNDMVLVNTLSGFDSKPDEMRCVARQSAFESSWTDLTSYLHSEATYRFINYGGGWQEARVRQASDGSVHIQGLVTTDIHTYTPPATLTVLDAIPSRYWPDKTLIFGAWAAFGGVAQAIRFNISAAGVISITAAPAVPVNYLSLNVVYFPEFA